MTTAPDLMTLLTDRVRRGGLNRWMQQVESAGRCARPVRLIGQSTTIASKTGEILSSYGSSSEPDGITYTRCGNRRASVCPSCSDEYKGDMWHLLVAGATGGSKGVPAAIRQHPLVFATLTAPSFGLVHASKKPGRPGSRRCRPRSRAALCRHGRATWCMATHDDHDPLAGQPLCAECYDYPGHVLWQWWAPMLWRVFTICLHRQVADYLGIDRDQLANLIRIQFAKVAEYQRRGIIHFHFLVRLDGPATSCDPFPAPPPGITAQRLCDLVRAAAAAASYTTPADPVTGPVRLAFGTQVDARPVHDTATRDDTAGQDLHPETVAAYIAKYATKATDDLEAGQRPVNPHLRRVRQTVDVLADRVDRRDPDSPYRRLSACRASLGFRGHFATKSRGYSTTLTELRRARHAWRTRSTRPLRTALADGQVVTRIGDDPANPGDVDDESTLVIKTWQYAGRGWATDGDTALAAQSAALALEHRHHRRP